MPGQAASAMDSGRDSRQGRGDQLCSGHLQATTRCVGIGTLPSPLHGAGQDGARAGTQQGFFASGLGSLPESGSLLCPHSPRSCLLFLLSSQRDRSTLPSSPYQNLPSLIHLIDPLREMELPPNEIETKRWGEAKRHPF